MSALTYEEFKTSFCRCLVDDGLTSPDMMRAAFKKSQGLDLDEEIEKFNRKQYELYLQRVQAGVE